MAFQASIQVDDPDGFVEKVFLGEDQKMANDRSSYSVSRNGSKTVINIESKDATALRAVTNSVCKILIVQEKAQAALKGE